MSPNDAQSVRWARFEEGTYAYFNQKFLSEEGGRLGNYDGPMLIYGLYLAIKQKNPLFIDVEIDNGDSATEEYKEVALAR